MQRARTGKGQFICEVKDVCCVAGKLFLAGKRVNITIKTAFFHMLCTVKLRCKTSGFSACSSLRCTVWESRDWSAKHRGAQCQAIKDVRPSAVYEADNQQSVSLADTKLGKDTSVINSSSAKSRGGKFPMQIKE